ncbi:hypothetical protein NPIL_437111, partial [Nephila pilipes]
RLKPCFSDNSPLKTDCAINHKSNPVDKPTSPVKKAGFCTKLPIAPQPDSQAWDVKLNSLFVINSEIHLGRVSHSRGGSSCRYLTILNRARTDTTQLVFCVMFTTK